MRNEVLSGYQGYGMPTPEEEFKRVTGQEFDPERYEILYHGADNDFAGDDPYVPYTIVEKVLDDEITKTDNSEEEIEKAYRTAVDDAIALYNLPEPTDSYERKAYNEEYIARSEEIRKALEILTPEKIKEAEEEIARKTKNSSNTNFDDVTENENVIQPEVSSEDENVIEPDITSEDENVVEPEISNEVNEVKEETNINDAKTKNKYIIDPNGIIVNFPSDNEFKDAISNYINNTNENTDHEEIIRNNDDLDNKFEKYVPKTHKNQRVGVLKRVVSRFNLIPLIATAAALVVSAFGRSSISKASKDKEIKEFTKNSASYSISTEDKQEPIYETREEAIQKTINGMRTGDKIHVDSGVDYHYSSDYEYAGYDRTGNFGSEIKKDGDYTLDYVSIIDPSTGLIRNVEYDKGKNVEDFINDTAKDIGIDRDKLKVKIEIGGPQTGWIDYDDYISCIDNGSIKQEVVETKIVPGTQIVGKQYNFDSKVTFIDENGKSAKVDFKKDDGSYYKVGENVTASNGQTYRIDKFDIDTETKTEKVDRPSKMSIPHNKITFGLSNISLLEALGAAAISLIGIPLTYRRKTEEKEMTDAEFRNIVGFGGYEPKKNDSESYYGSWWDGLTHNKETIKFIPDDSKDTFSFDDFENKKTR